LPRGPASSGCADFAFSGCPLRGFPSMHPAADPATYLRVAPQLTSFQLCRRWIFGSPRISHPSAVLAVKVRVAPNLRSTNSACEEDLGCPASCIFRLPAVILRVAPNLRSSGLRRWKVLRVASNRASLSGAGGEFSGYPESSVLRRCRLCVFGLPRLLH